MKPDSNNLAEIFEAIIKKAVLDYHYGIEELEISVVRAREKIAAVVLKELSEGFSDD